MGSAGANYRGFRGEVSIARGARGGGGGGCNVSDQKWGGVAGETATATPF